MLLNIIVIVLRETLEASILISILLSISQQYKLSLGWLPVALLAGLIGAVFYALNLGQISEWFDYVGQEVVNALMQYVVYAGLAIVGVVQYQSRLTWHSRLPLFMSLAVAFAVVREGSELVIFYSGFLEGGATLSHAATSGFIGLAIGLSAGALCFYGLQSMRHQSARKVHLALLTMIAGGLVLQATQLLIQADWLSVESIVWDSNAWLPESSMLGQLAYAVFGYEATPSQLEMMAYVVSMILILGVAAWGRLTDRPGEDVRRA